ncbi:MAG: deoxyribonuclease V [Candidatus Magnetobacterium sp. LHC-1]|uniref:Endonuclease V n=1 Tax=Candidatus Magnetobacterium casense TaxID=1455061 RepID=A0ABS6S2S6_9BACT|nr:deoxyribonuclease V [Candidatus Magnetobacterium casensis]MBF0607938.1 endonuclease V [Nitrospirota bacterium]MBV6342895.1 endonuclease V [Candidatus Magnetobacterium casensis]
MQDVKLSKNLRQARHTQLALAQRVRIEALGVQPCLVAGVDAAFSDNKVIGSACLFDYDTLHKVHEVSVVQEVEFPYVAGFLSFREAPVIIGAIKLLQTPPNLIIVDGQGIAHPRRIGLASHIGVLLGIPTVGCAKSRLIGVHQEPGPHKGNWQYLYDKEQQIGAVLRSRDNVSPLYISPGHLIDISGCLDVILHTTTRYRLPEPIRCAHNLSAQNKRLLT